MLNQIAAIHGTGAAPAAANSFESIATVSVGAGGASSVSFSSIPSTFKHLQVRYISRDVDSASEQYFLIKYNSDSSSSNYTWHSLQGDGSTATAAAAATGVFAGNVINYTAGGGASIYSAGVLDLLDYTNTNKYTTMRALNGYDNNGSGVVNLQSGLWLNTAAITSINFTFANGGNIAQYSQFALYGIKG